MLCPYCSHGDSKVIDSRDSGEDIRRRRECLRCGLRYTTYERVQTRALQLIKRDGRHEDFNRDKLWVSLTKACAKRPIPLGAVDKIVEDIEALLADVGKAEIPSQAIGELVMDRLKGLDRVAYIRFASVYRDFRDIETFKDEIDALLEPRQVPETTPGDQPFLPGMEDAPVFVPTRRRGRRRKEPQPGSSQ